jgi:ADP-ribose pyrophosphatase YjhB (NUDIX family)
MRVRSLVQRQNMTVLAVPDPTNGEKFVIPGGEVREGEAPEDAAGRHLREQTGLEPTAAVYLFEDEENGETTVTMDMEYKQPRFRKDREKVNEKAKFVGPVNVVQGDQGDYNWKLLVDLLGMDFSDVIDEVMEA